MSPEVTIEKSTKLNLKAKKLLKLRLTDKEKYRLQLSREIGREIACGDEFAQALLDNSSPNEYQEISSDVAKESESLFLEGIGFGRLFAVPVIFHPDSGTKINAHAMHDMLKDVFGIIEDATLTIMANFRSLDAVEGLGAGGRRQLLKSLMNSKHKSPIETLGLEKPMPNITGRGVEAVILGFILTPTINNDEISVLDQNADMNKVIPFQKAMIRLETCLIDIGVPSSVSDISTYHSEASNWAVLRTGIQQEINDFFEMARGQYSGISALIRKNESSFVVYALDPEEKPLDKKEITPYMVPVSMKELEQLVMLRVDKVRYLPPSLALPKFLNYEAPARQYLGRPYLSVVDKAQFPIAVMGKE